MPTVDVLILANGLSTRLDCSPPFAKTFTDLCGRPILRWLLDEVADSQVVGKTRLFVRPGVIIPPALKKPLQAVEIFWAEPDGYFRDVIAALESGSRTVVIDSDLVSPPGEVGRFLREFSGDADCDLAIGYQASSSLRTARDIQVRLDENSIATELGRELPSTGFESVGIFGWSPHMVDRGRSALPSEQSVTRFLSDEVRRGKKVRAIRFRAAVNCNSVADVERGQSLMAPYVSQVNTCTS